MFKPSSFVSLFYSIVEMFLTAFLSFSCQFLLLHKFVYINIANSKTVKQYTEGFVHGQLATLSDIADSAEKDRNHPEMFYIMRNNSSYDCISFV